MSRYSVLVIPEDHLESKRFHLPKSFVHLGFVVVVLLFSFTTVMTWGFIHYRQIAHKVSETASPNEEIYRSQILTKIGQLEESLNRTQQFASRMESMVEVDAGKMKMGVGPLSEHDDFSKYLEKISRLPKPQELDFNAKGQKSENLYQKMEGRLEELSDYAFSLETHVNEVYELSQDKLSYWASTPSIWPVHGFVTSEFGSRISPISGMPKFHEGLDIAAPYGSPIFAPSDGFVTFTGYKGGYGNTLVVDHGYGVSTMFAHTSSILAKEGQKVKRGQLVAFVGSTGAATGPHLHYEVHVDGVPTDPMRYILR
jgi:murein DD-endopeptidase MepM/ murein hydrolase activator NlpD